jgi:hypothetical protein
MVVVAVVGVLFGVVARWPVALVLSFGIMAVVAIEGLSLVELLVVVAITGVVAGLFVEGVNPHAYRRRVTAAPGPVNGAGPSVDVDTRETGPRQ